MDLELDGNHVFIAGASRGIGFGMAEAFAREGAKVTLTGRGEGSLDAARKALIDKGVAETQLCTVAVSSATPRRPLMKLSRAAMTWAV